MKPYDACSDLVRDYIHEKLGKKLSRLASAASADLWYGPQGSYCLCCEGNTPGTQGSSLREECSCSLDATHPGYYPGWSTAVDTLSEAVDTHVDFPLYVDIDTALVSSAETQPYLVCGLPEDEEHTHDDSCYSIDDAVWQFDRKEALRAAFGELGGYL